MSLTKEKNEPWPDYDGLQYDLILFGEETWGMNIYDYRIPGSTNDGPAPKTSGN